MGHNIEAIIAKKPINEAKAAAYGLAVAYESDYAIVILFEDSIYYWSCKLDLDFLSIDEDFNEASETAFFLAAELGIEQYAFIRTDYFGGMGYQHALFMEKGALKSKENSINDALKKIGVVAKEGLDEFDTLNLGQYRGMEEYYWEGAQNFALRKVNMLRGKVLKD
jgi:hypothetical protein